MSNTKFKPGTTGNPNGRPKGTGKPISRLRSTLEKLKKLEASSIRNIEAVINGEHNLVDDDENSVSIDKMQIETSKWLISTLVSVTRAVVAEESSRTPGKSQEDDESEEGEAKLVKFSTRQ